MADIRKRLNLDGYGAAQIHGPTLYNQLQKLIRGSDRGAGQGLKLRI